LCTGPKMLKSIINNQYSDWNILLYPILCIYIIKNELKINLGTFYKRNLRMYVSHISKYNQKYKNFINYSIITEYLYKI